MIDDVTVSTVFAPGTDVRLRSLIGGEPIIYDVRQHPRTGLEHQWAIIRGRGFILRLCDATRELELRLSVPRLGYAADAPHTYNFPLQPYRTVDDWPLGPVTAGVVQALGLSEPNVSPADALLGIDVQPIPSWVVKSVALSADVETADVRGTIMAFTSCRRRGRAQTKPWGHPPHAVQWDGAGYRAMFYSKADEILHRIKPIKKEQDEYEEASVEFREELAAAAANIVRFEASLRSAGQLRKLWKLPADTLPTLRAVASPGVDAFVLGKELRRLQLHLLDTKNDTPHEGLTIRDLALLVAEKSASLTSRSKGSVSGSRRLAMFALLELHGCMSDAEIAGHFGMELKTVQALHGDLRKAGLLALGTRSPARQRLLTAFMARFHEHFPALPEKMPALDSNNGPLHGPSPWGAVEEEPEVGVPDDDS